MKEFLLIFLGGGAGAVVRYTMYLLVIPAFPSVGLSVGTLTVNLLGCFLIGYSMPYFITAGPGGDTLRLFFVTGVLGGFTTFSAFGYETAAFLRAGQFFAALCYTTVSVGGGLVAVAVGALLSRYS